MSQPGVCSFVDGIDGSECMFEAEFVVTRLAGGSEEAKACGWHLADVLMTGDLEPAWVVRPVER